MRGWGVSWGSGGGEGRVHFMFNLPRPKADIKFVFLYVTIMHDCHKITIFKVGTHDGTSPPRLVPLASPCDGSL